MAHPQKHQAKENTHKHNLLDQKKKKNIRETEKKNFHDTETEVILRGIGKKKGKKSK